MPQVLNSDAELAAKRLHTTDAALTNTFAGVSTLTGSVRISGQPSCRLRNNVVQPINHATYTALSFDTELGDVGGMHKIGRASVRKLAPNGTPDRGKAMRV